MDIVNRLASTNVYCEIVPQDQLGAPGDPTGLVIEIAFSATRILGDTPTWLTATWQVDTESVPPRYYAKTPVGAAQLASGVWWPFTRIHNSPETMIVRGLPFRVE